MGEGLREASEKHARVVQVRNRAPAALRGALPLPDPVVFGISCGAFQSPDRLTLGERFLQGRIKSLPDSCFATKSSTFYPIP
jgi:hypothetical protein